MGRALGQAWPLAVALLVSLSASSVFATSYGPRGSTYGVYGPAAGNNRHINAPVLRAITPMIGVKEGGSDITIHGANFMRTNTLKVKIAATYPKTEVDVVNASYVDTSTIVFEAPNRDTAHTAHITVSNDGKTYSATAMVTAGGPHTYLLYDFVDTRPGGHWSVDNTTFPAQGGGEVSLLLDGVYLDGEPEGAAFYDGGNMFCAFSNSVRRVHTWFSPVSFDDKTPGSTINRDMEVVVAEKVRDDYDTYVSTNFTYELVMTDNSVPEAPEFKWRKFAAEMYPYGLYSDPIAVTTEATVLDYGVTITFGTTTGKDVGDTWTFTVYSQIRTIVPATYIDDRRARCKAPLYDASIPDRDPYTPGIQHELLISNRGNYSFSAPTVYNATDDRVVTGASYTHGEGPHSLSRSMLEGFNEDAKLIIEGFYTGVVEMNYEVKLTSPTKFKWRKYLYGAGSGYGEYFHGYDIKTELQELDNGVWVKWATTDGKVAGDRWTWTAFTYWSTPYSTVYFNDGGEVTEGDDIELVVEGVYSGEESYTYEVMVQVDHSAFKWRKYPYGSQPAGAWSDQLWTTTTRTLLDAGVTVRWVTLFNKHYTDTWTFTAYKGHVVTYYSKSYISPAVPGAHNMASDPRTPTTSGIFLGNETTTYTLKITGDCSTSCTHFKWKRDSATHKGHYQEEDLVLEMGPLELADGVMVMWGPTSGYQKGNTYTITAKPMPTSILPVDPQYSPVTHVPGSSTFAVVNSSTFHQAGDIPPRDVVYTLDFVASDRFRWRRNTEAFSDEISVDTQHPWPLGDMGVNLTFVNQSGYSVGTKYLIDCRTHIPNVFNVSTPHFGNRAASSISQPVAAYANYLNEPNQGSLIGQVLPYAANRGNHTITTTPTPGFHSTGVVGSGISNLVTAVPTPGYSTFAFNHMYIMIAGEAEITPVVGALPDDMTVGGHYSGDSSFVYEVMVHGDPGHFVWRKYPKGLTNINATKWHPHEGLKISTHEPATVDHTMHVTFAKKHYPVGTTWTFRGEKGHTFKYREGGKQDWHGPVEINGATQDLASGVSVVFGEMSGYATGDNFMITNRTVNSYGTYFGEEDSTYTVEVAGHRYIDTPYLIHAPDSETTGLASEVTVTGNYKGNETFTYELVVVDDSVIPTTFKWRRFLRGYGLGGGPYSREVQTTLSPQYLDQGLYVSWGAVTNMAKGDTWYFDAHSGDTFRWRKDGGPWSIEQQITDVGLVEPDRHNLGSQTPNVDVISLGTYNGTIDVTYAVEILAYGKSFRWKINEYLPLGGAYRGTYEVLFGEWSAAVAMVAGIPIEMNSGVFVQFNKDSGWHHGDIFYVPAKATTHHKLSDGVRIVFGAASGYSQGDVWTFHTRYALPARGPLDGNTEVVVAGENFLPSDNLRCKFLDDATGFEMVVPAQYDSGERIRCRTTAHPPNTVSEPEFFGLGLSAMQVGGIFEGTKPGVTEVTVVMHSGSKFIYRVDSGDWSDPIHVSTDWYTLPLGQGIRVKFGAASGYTANDFWTFKAFYMDRDALNEQVEIQLGSIKPGTVKYVYVSNDGGVTWSKERSSLTRFLFSDIYVSPSGDDKAGEGTYAAPYATLQKAIGASLSAPRTAFEYHSLQTGEHYLGATDTGLARVINRDFITVAPGRYSGMGNTGLVPMGKMLMLSASQRGEAVIDCEYQPTGDIYNGDRFQRVSTQGHATIRGINVENCGNRFIPLGSNNFATTSNPDGLWYKG